jgi:hypothetical protein
MIASLLWPGVISRPKPFSFHWQLGDLATWVLALIALLALTAAILAYRKQSSSDDHLAEQVNLLGDALDDQRKASAALADQAQSQREALKDQQAANAKQAEVLEAQLAELRQRAAAIARQQADAVTIASGQWRGAVPGVRTEGGPPVHKAVVKNGWYRPVNNVVCRLQTEQNGAMYSACLVARRAPVPPSPFPNSPTAANLDGYTLVDRVEDTKIRLLKAGDVVEFVFVYDVASHQGIFTLRFTDDAGLHWQVDDDLHLQQLADRDDW